MKDHNRVIVENIRNIKRLEFNLPPEGVTLLVGANGIGKTSLLTCLARIGSSSAFRESFISPRTSNPNIVSPYEDSSVEYITGQGRVTFQKTKKKWQPKPKSSTNLLKYFGYSSVVYKYFIFKRSLRRFSV